MEETYTHLIALLNQHEAHYRLIDHAPEGRTELVSAMCQRLRKFAPE
jgi:Ala-tRNA(Pro) deacylase